MAFAPSATGRGGNQDVAEALDRLPKVELHCRGVFWRVQSTLADRGGWTRLAYESVIDGAAHSLVYTRSHRVAPRRSTRCEPGAGGRRVPGGLARNVHLCGHRFQPIRDPSRFPVCPKCKELASLLD